MGGKRQFPETICGTTGPYAILKFKKTIIFFKHNDWTLEEISAGGAFFAYLVSMFSLNFPKKSSGAFGKAGLFLVGVLGFVFFWVIYLTFSYWLIFPHVAPNWLKSLASILSAHHFLENYLSAIHYPYPQGHIFSAYALAASFLWIYSLFFFDANDTSLHNFYRDRLSKAYLFSWDQKDNINSIQRNDEQKLSQLGSTSPYHLINCALNVKNPEEAYQKGRKADFFIFSKLFIGGKLTGYCKTEDMEAIRHHVNLGTAMAISGASSTSNMGKSIYKPLAFILGMLNIRLNYWLPNPRIIGQIPSSVIKKQSSANIWMERISWAAHKPKVFLNLLNKYIFRPWSPLNAVNRVGPYYFILEMLGWLDAKSWNVNLSDGGHIENLGVFELLRRECRFIIASDGECDPGLNFEAISELTRLAKIDLGIQIIMEGLDLIREGKQQHAIGTIKYENGKKGVLIYLKSSLLGDNSLSDSLKNDFYQTSVHRNDNRRYDDNPYVAHYKAKHPAFPHETTGDQLFDETQFECYRALGFNVALNTFTFPGLNVTSGKEDKNNKTA